MTVADDPNDKPGALSATARRMLALRRDVFDAWERQVRAQVPHAGVLAHPILVDTLPVFYYNIAESLSPGYPRDLAVDGNTVASEHGGERARVTSYDLTALIEEYQVFRWAIFHVLQREQVALDHPETHTIHASIDAAIQQAVEAFTLVHSGFRERFAAALTHDLRGPLGATASALELILLSDDPAKMKTFAATALKNARRVAGMIDELLDTMAFHGDQKIHLDIVPVDAAELAREVQADAAAVHGQHIGIVGGPVNGWWDRSALKRAIENLVGNAIKYGRPGTPVTISMEQAAGRLALSVHNEGAPIPPGEQECIFQMYRRAESAALGARQGWGIGLPYVRAVAESHGGSVGLDSSLERGTTFTIDIPLDGRLFHDAPTLANEPR